MAGCSPLTLWRDIQTLFDAGTAHGLSDRQLLERFAGRRVPDPAAEAAFEVLVLRHGPMVFRVCRNLLSDPNDAQDAFQATFLVLVRRCGSLRQYESLGGWIYGVAHRVAARARVEAARRRAVEGRAALRVVGVVEPAAAGAQTDRAELGPIVQEEVRRLPQRYRSVVVLCYFEGLTQEQAAAQLGCPVGTVRSRLVRARELLRRRLTRRGLAPLAGLGAAELSCQSASGSVLGSSGVPAELARATIRAAVRVGARWPISQVAPGFVSSLVERVLGSMAMIKFSAVAGSIVLIGLAGYGAGLAAWKAGQARSDRAVTREEAGPSTPAGQRAGPLSGKHTKNRVTDAVPKAARFEAIYSNVQGQTTLVRVVPDGSVVKKGDVLGELDSAALRDSLVNQRITTKSAESNFENARLARKDGEWTLSSYENDRFPREERELVGEAKLAGAELAVAEEELMAVKTKGPNDQLTLKRAELAVARARLAEEKASNRHHILTHYTKGKTIRELTWEVEKARSNELAKEAVWELEKSKEEKLERQIAACTLIAPIDGTVVYAEFVRQEGALSNPPRLLRMEVGATVRERQLILRIVPAPRADSANQ